MPGGNGGQKSTINKKGGGEGEGSKTIEKSTEVL